MANPYLDYPIDMIDISEHNEDFDPISSPERPDLAKAKAQGISVISARTGYGRRRDRSFPYYWEMAKRLQIYRMSYWWGDYYSHKTANLGLTDYQWGVEQGNNWYSWLNGDYGEIKQFLDCEESGYGGRITLLNRNSYNTIMRAIAETMDRLTGVLTGIYCSPGFIPNLQSWARNRDLWVAWYNPNKTKAEIIAYCRNQGWTGRIVFWQYSSDGDINLDGISDGLSFGLESAKLDLNAWLESVEEFSKYAGQTTPIDPIPDPDPEPIPDPGTPGLQYMKVISRDGLNIRNRPIGVYGSTVEKWMPNTTRIVILESKILGSNKWHRIGYDQWSAEIYNGFTFLIRD